MEQEINAAQPVMKPYRMEPQPARRRSGFGGKFFFLLLLLGIPAAVVWAANLPYAPIRRPIARNMPILLLPSYMHVDRDFRDAIALTEQSKQLIDNATSFADIQMGAQKVTEAQAKLDALPLDLVSYWPNRYYYWYDWRFSPVAFNGARAEVGRLQAKVFQEQNAHTVLTDVEQALNKAKQNYQAAPDLVSKQAAITAWRVALNQMEIVPAQTLAGDIARQKLEPEKDEFQAIVGESATSRETAVLIESARSFAWEAAKRAQNPPHSVEEWAAIEQLWEKAIYLLSQVSATTDPTGFAEAQKLMATYQSNRLDISIRKQAESEAIDSLKRTQQEIQSLLAQLNYMNANQVAARLQGILTELNSIKPGTTAYKEAEILRLQTNNKLQEISR
ncbi:hypothetical protein [Leptolyngbya sp. FACHB-8]|uniref:hypothetical protein n=1 Tax=unclassified Leptolyngbya TaxID=2650499 RepID=UPI00168416FB|nr:hypothetical protein [Leptolyngbya sp. FACHB-8]MBD1910762.1 hypothetical protein [Leptolyngbya sp. FACHB-8]